MSPLFVFLSDLFFDPEFLMKAAGGDVVREKRQRVFLIELRAVTAQSREFAIEKRRDIERGSNRFRRNAESFGWNSPEIDRITVTAEFLKQGRIIAFGGGSIGYRRGFERREI